MLLFCPSCSNMLRITPLPLHESTPGDIAAGRTDANRFECRTCPYQMTLDRKYYERREFARRGVEDILGGEGSWKNVDKTKVQCPAHNCDGGEAYFRQAQIRSADEPMTNFYKCVDCGHDWREN